MVEKWKHVNFRLIGDIVTDEVFIDASVGTEFTDGDELVFLFTEGFSDILHECAGRTVFTACNVFDVFWINDDPPGYVPGE